MCVRVCACERERKKGCVYVRDRDRKSVYEGTLYAVVRQVKE